MPSLKVAAVQFELRGEPTLEGFLQHVEERIKEAADGGAELVVFPEFASTGLLETITDHAVTSATVGDDYRHHLSSMEGEIRAGLQRLAAQYGIVVLGGSHNRIAEDGTLRNTAYLVRPDGRIESQDKLHLTPQEHEMGTLGGDDLLVTEIGPFTVGVLICADIQFPELSRYLVSRGVNLILCPSLTWNRRGIHRVATGCQARAIENQLYVVMSPLFGSDGLPQDAPIYATGKALVAGPVDRTIGVNDGILARTESTEEQVLFADLDLDLLLASRANPEAPGLKLQRPDLYAKLRAEL